MMNTANTTESDDWTPDRIESLRKERGQSRAEFGLDIYDATESGAYSMVHRMEHGERSPGSAARKTLERMERGVV
jgi:DNA-binding transcriptional regulator YiaG